MKLRQPQCMWLPQAATCTLNAEMPVPRHVKAPLRERGVWAEAAGAYAGPAVRAAGGNTW